jgi:glycosyltransferase involved in cell wall biosynthesis
MKVLIVNNAVPFIWGGAEELAINLSKKLNIIKGVEAEVLRIPFQWEPKARLYAEILLNRNFRIDNADRVIALKFPAYHVQHEHKSIWLLHQFRQAYDLLDAGKSYLSRGFDDDLIATITKSDNECFEASNCMYTNSPVTQGRLLKYNDLKSEVLYPPLNDEVLFTPGEYGDYIFAGGRVDRGKRQHLLIEGAYIAGPKCRLVIAGPPSDTQYADELKELVSKYEIGNRVHLSLRMHTRRELADLATNALACAYVPYDEDSLGYVAMEAVSSAKALLTTTDAGGILGIVTNMETGLICEPTSLSIGDALSRICSNKAWAQRLGAKGYEYWQSKNITWKYTIDRLLS